MRASPIIDWVESCRLTLCEVLIKGDKHVHRNICSNCECQNCLKIIKSAKDLANYGELVAAVSEVSSKLMDATAVALASQEKQGVLIARIAELERELANLSEAKKKQSRYKLHEFSTGVLAYALKEDCADGEPHHYLCATCMDKNNTTKMQPNHTKRRLWCPECKTDLQIESEPPSPSLKLRRSTYY